MDDALKDRLRLQSLDEMASLGLAEAVQRMVGEDRAGVEELLDRHDPERLLWALRSVLEFGAGSMEGMGWRLANCDIAAPPAVELDDFLELVGEVSLDVEVKGFAGGVRKEAGEGVADGDAALRAAAGSEEVGGGRGSSDRRGVGEDAGLSRSVAAEMAPVADAKCRAGKAVAVRVADPSRAEPCKESASEREGRMAVVKEDGESGERVPEQGTRSGKAVGTAEPLVDAESKAAEREADAENKVAVTQDAGRGATWEEDEWESGSAALGSDSAGYDFRGFFGGLGEDEDTSADSILDDGEEKRGVDVEALPGVNVESGLGVDAQPGGQRDAQADVQAEKECGSETAKAEQDADSAGWPAGRDLPELVREQGGAFDGRLSRLVSDWCRVPEWDSEARARAISEAWLAGGADAVWKDGGLEAVCGSMGRVAGAVLEAMISGLGHGGGVGVVSAVVARRYAREAAAVAGIAFREDGKEQRRGWLVAAAARALEDGERGGDRACLVAAVEGFDAVQREGLAQLVREEAEKMDLESIAARLLRSEEGSVWVRELEVLGARPRELGAALALFAAMGSVDRMLSARALSGGGDGARENDFLCDVEGLLRNRAVQELRKALEGLEAEDRLKAMEQAVGLWARELMTLESRDSDSSSEMLVRLGNRMGLELQRQGKVCTVHPGFLSAQVEGCFEFLQGAERQGWTSVEGAGPGGGAAQGLRWTPVFVLRKANSDGTFGCIGLDCRVTEEDGDRWLRFPGGGSVALDGGETESMVRGALQWAEDVSVGSVVLALFVSDAGSFGTVGDLADGIDGSGAVDGSRVRARRLEGGDRRSRLAAVRRFEGELKDWFGSTGL